MSILARRVAASEGAFFSQTSKEAIARLREKAARSSSPIVSEGSASASPSSSSSSSSATTQANADVLPEILQHSLPEQQQYDHKLPSMFSPPPSSLFSLASAKSSPPGSYRRTDTSGLNFLPTLPQASFGPRRWRPADEEVNILPSTANEARLEGMPTLDDDTAKALLDGYAVVVKAFLIATAIVVGGATVGTTLIVSKLQIRSIDDIRTKGHEHMQSRVEEVRQIFEPWRQMVQERSKNQRVTNSQRSAVATPFTQVLGLKQLANKVKEE